MYGTDISLTTDISADLHQADGMKISIAIGLQVIGCTYAGISHNGGAATGFIGKFCHRIATATTVHIVVERMICAKFMAHLMRYIIDIKSITHRNRLPCHALCFITQ